MDQSHSAFPALSRFPPQHEDQSWVATAGTVLDAAAIMLSIGRAERGRRDQAALGPVVLVLAHGIPAMARIAQAAGLDVDDPPPLVDLVLLDEGDLPSISVSRAEYERPWRSWSTPACWPRSTSTRPGAASPGCVPATTRPSGDSPA